ncbi:MAG: hypothetical protein HOL85_23410 [Rhodospirillaceae bacterium]|jgi:fructose-1,6-bisphosphatase/inositol monophosphatase family enzyme|nr:hypothetical protein [Rhodospirillaceae bacterium]
MQATLDTIETLVIAALAEVSGELAARCGNVANLGKQTLGVANTAVHGALTELDGRVQDHVTRALLAADLDLGFLVEEDTDLLRGHGCDTGELAAIFDPIDGTLSYIRGQHDYTSLFAVSRRGRIVMGILAFYHPFKCLVGRIDRPQSPAVDQHQATGTLRIVCHYRLFQETYRATRQRLEDAGHLGVPMPLDLNVPEHQPFAWAMDKGLGSNGAAVAAMLEGHWDAYIGPWVALHDFAGPWGVAEATGAVCVKFDTPADAKSNIWAVDPGPRFLVRSPADYPKRYRILIARDQRVADQVCECLASLRD